MAATLYKVRYRYDDRRGGLGTCTTDHPLARGDLFYARDGRATVVACYSFTPVAEARAVAQGGSYRIGGGGR